MKKLIALACLALILGMQASAQAQTIEPGRSKGSISIPSFTRLLNDAGDSIHLIDVSSAREYATGSIKGASNIPINQLEKQLASLPTDKPIIFFCATGGRASEAYDTVKMLRPEMTVHFLDAQVQIRPDGSPNIR